jgi:tRNA/rRNA methyltransferase
MSFCVVLVRPETSQNVGAVARVMKNTGLRDLRLVDPGDWRTVDAWRSAWGSHEILESTRVLETLEAALADTSFAVALSGRDDDAIVQDVRDAVRDALRNGPPEAAAGIACATRPGPRALVFGPEASGLTLAEMALCGRRASIPCHPDQPSFNLSHAVAITAYELMRARKDFRDAAALDRSAATGAAANAIGFRDRAALIEDLRPSLAAVGALRNRELYARQFTAFMNRLDLSRAEARWLRHVAFCLSRAARAAGWTRR